MTNYDFTGKSIKCDTWKQMLHLSKLAEKQNNAKPNERWGFSEMEFNNGNVWFVLDHNYMTYVCQSVPTGIYDIEISYTDFINPPLPTETIEVTGCEDCPFHTTLPLMTDWCSHPKHENKEYVLFDSCPLNQKDLTIKLKTK